MFTTIDKALVPGVALVILGGLGYFGVTDAMSVTEAVTLLVTAFFVWLVPNK